MITLAETDTTLIGLGLALLGALTAAGVWGALARWINGKAKQLEAEAEAKVAEARARAAEAEAQRDLLAKAIAAGEPDGKEGPVRAALGALPEETKTGLKPVKEAATKRLEKTNEGGA